MKIFKLFFISIIAVSLFGSCKKDTTTVTGNTTVLTPAMARDSLYLIMNDWYYWNTLMPVVNKDAYADPYLLMDAMRYKPLDRWSFVADYDEFMAEMQGSFVGHGFRIGLDDEGNARIAMIYSESPLYAEGVRRGWIVEQINGTDIAPILQAQDGTAYSNLIGPGKAGITNTFLFRKPDGTETTIVSTKMAFTLNSVISYDTLQLSSGLAGHLVFDSFIEPSEDELASAFAFFNAHNVKDFILDLRYNTGGYLYIAQELASYLAGNNNAGSDFVKLSYNNRHLDYNGTYSLLSTPFPLSLSKIVVITTRETASASECVMNGLKPYMEVVSIGDTTNGKPVGMNGGNIGDKYFIAPVTFKMVNKDDEGDYFDGIVPMALVSDDITHDFSDRNEACLQAAISYLENGTAKSKSLREFKRNPRYSERPEYLNNAFVIDK